MDVKYAVAAHGLAEAYYVRINKILVFLQVICTSSVVLAAAKLSAELTAAVGLVLALVSGFQQAAKPLAEAAKHGTAREKFAMLEAKVIKGKMEQGAIDAELATLRAKVPRIPRPLQFAAYNDNLMTNGRPDGLVKEDWSIKLIRRFT